MSVLLIAEHNNKELRPFTLMQLTAASQIDTDVHALIIGQIVEMLLNLYLNYLQ
jgi:electron transfer flavoprotein alpha subunit